MRRPALWAALFFATGIGLQIFLGASQWMLILGATAIMLACLYGFKMRWLVGTMSALLAVLLVLLGALRWTQSQGVSAQSLHRFLPFADSPVEIFGQVVSEPESVRDDRRAIFAVKQLTLHDTIWSVQGHVLVQFRKEVSEVSYGDRLHLSLLIYKPDPPRNPGAFDYRAYLNRRGIEALGTVQKNSQVLAIEPGLGDWWHMAVLPVRRTIREAIERNLSGGPAGLLKGVLLGEKRAIPEHIQTAFARTGVNHVLAVSGLHVGLIAGVVFFACKMLGLGRYGTSGLTICMLILYAVVTGLPPSVVRASTMGCVALIGVVGQRDLDAGNILGLAGLGLLIARPQDFLDVGFQLSFAATGGILLFYQPLKGMLPGKRMGWCEKWLAGPLAVSLAAQVTTLPFVVNYFGLLSVVGIIANLIIVPLIGVGVGLGLLTVIVYVVWEPVTTILNATNWLVLKGVIWCAIEMAQPGWAAIEVARPHWYVWGIYLSLIPILHPEGRRMFGAYLLMATLIFANIGVWQNIIYPSSGLKVIVLDVGQGDATFLRFPNGRTVLVDGGIRTSHVDMGARVVLPYLKQQGYSHIDVVIGSHPHADHIGGLITVLERISVGHYLDAGQVADSWVARRLHEVIKARGIRYHSVAAGDSLLGIGGLVLHPTAAYVSTSGPAPDGLNNGSVVIRIAHAGKSLLLTGDIELETDNTLGRWGDRLHSDVLKAAHHGSRTSSTDDFLRCVQPKIVTVSCGIGNKFGHPSPEVIQRYIDMGLKIWRTDQSGAIVMQLEEEGIHIAPWIRQ